MTEYSQNDLVEELKKAYLDELESLNNYLSLGEYIEGLYGQGVVAEDLIKDVDEELNHAKRLSKRIAELDGKPPLSVEYEASQTVVSSVEDENDVKGVVESVIQLESDAIKQYKKIVEIAEEVNDPVTRNLAEDLLADEEEHLDEFEGFLEDL